MNALTELIQASEGRTIKAAWIGLGWDYDNRDYEVRIDYTEEQAADPNYSDFDRALNGINYDDGFGSQKLFGLVWFTDGSWLERHEYDGAESWAHKSLPPIPAHLRKQPKIVCHCGDVDCKGDHMDA